MDQITEAQRECLRLVLRQYSSKEIAAQLGVSPSAVDKRIERAVQVLGASSRFDAARMLAAVEDGTSDRLPWQAIDVPTSTDDPQPEEANGPWGLARRLVGLTPGGRDAGKARVRLSKPRRFALLAVLMLITAVTSMVLLNLASTLSSLITTHRSPPR